MVAGTHFIFSAVLYLGGAAALDYETDLISFAIAVLASLGPDIDLPTSKPGRIFFWVSTHLEKRFGHRTITHSWIGMLIVITLASPIYLYQPMYFWAVIGGYWSHIFIDMANIRGVDLYWPSQMRVVLPAKRKYRIEVGSKAEMIFMAGLFIAAIALYPVSSVGFKGGLQSLLQSFDIAYDDFMKQSGSQWFTLDLKAIDNLTLQEVECECQVLGNWKNGLIIMHNGKPRAVGMSSDEHNLYPRKARLLKGEPLKGISQKVDMSGHSLRWLLSQVDKSKTYYLSGQMMVAESFRGVQDIDLYSPVRFSGNMLKMHYAREVELGRYLDLKASEGEVFIQYWLKEGESGPVVGRVVVEDREVMPELLIRNL